MLNILQWYLVMLLFSIVTLPISIKLFKNFKDGGYIFSKVIGLGISRICNVVVFYITYS